MSEQIDNALVIAEGEVVEQNYFVHDGNNLVYTDNKIKINKIFKGDLISEYFHLVTIGGVYNGEVHQWSHQFKIGKEASGMFFLKPASHPSSSEIQHSYELVAGSQGFVPYIQEDAYTSPRAILNKKDVLDGNPNTLYKFIEQKTSTTRKFISSSSYEKSLIQSVSIDTEDCVEYNLINIQVNEIPSFNAASSYSVEFDIKIKSLQEEINLQKVEISMEYSTGLFGSNIVLNNRISVSLGGDLSVYESSLVDETPSKVKMDIEIASGSTPITIDNFGRQLYHASILIQNFDPVAFLQLSVDENFDIKTSKVDDGVVSELECNLFDGDIDGPVSSFFAPSISEIISENPINPDDPLNTAPAGTRFVHSLITIKGDDFGDQRGESRVNFTVLDGDGFQWCAPLDGDYVYWNNTEIQVLVPSYGKPPELSDADVGAMTLQKPGTGAIRIDKVVIENGEPTHIYSTENPNAFLTIPYSVRNDKRSYTQGYKGKPEFMFDQNLNGGYTIQFSAEFKFIHTANGTNTEILRTVESGETYVDLAKAVAAKWRCKTGLNFVVDEDNTWNEQFGCEEDNIIGLHLAPDTDTDEEDLMSTSAITKLNQSCLVEGMDIESNLLRCAEIWVVAEKFDNLDDDGELITGENTKERFYNALLHEMGHAHFLNHVRESSELMKPSLIKGTTAQITDNAIIASRYIQEFSENHNCCEGKYISDECFPNSIDEVVLNPENRFKVYTGSNNIVVENLDGISLKEVTIYDSTGRLLQLKKSLNSNRSILLPKIEIPGIYIVSITDENNQRYSYKINSL